MNSRNKGAAFERKIAKLLSDALGISFKRTPQSGAFSTNNKYSALAGDIYCEADFPYVIECKKYSEYNLEDLVTGATSGMLKWFEQLETEKGNKKGLLIFQKNYGKIMAAIEGVYPAPKTIIWGKYTLGLLDTILPIIKKEL